MPCLSKPTLLKARASAKRVFLRCLPHALLCVTYLLYLIFGTLIFQAIEGHGSTELEDYLDAVADMRSQLEAEMWNKSLDMSKNWTEMMDEYTHMVSRPEWKMGRLQTMQDVDAWSFPSTMLFCLITITTIGKSLQ